MTSCKISRSRVRSATIRLSREFSSSSSRNRFISDGNKPPYLFCGKSQCDFYSASLQLKYVAWLIPALRHTSATGIPSSPCFSMNAFCASVNFDAFIAFAPSQPGIITRKLQPQTRDFSGSRSQETTECSQRPISHLCFYGTLIYSVTSLAALSPRTACSKNRDASQVKGVGYEASRHQPRQCDLPSDAERDWKPSTRCPF